MQDARRDRWPLDPIDRLSEIMFGLLMALTFTGSMSVALGAGGTVRDVLLAALGCNIAWGAVDAWVYVVTTMTERTRVRSRTDSIRLATGGQSRHLLREALPGELSTALSDTEIDTLADWIRSHPRPGPRRELTGADMLAALQVFLLVTTATFPPILPFLFLDDLPTAMRVSNWVAVLMLFALGVKLDRQMNDGSWIMRLIVPIFGTSLVGLTILLGG